MVQEACPSCGAHEQLKLSDLRFLSRVHGPHRGGEGDSIGSHLGLLFPTLVAPF